MGCGASKSSSKYSAQTEASDAPTVSQPVPKEEAAPATLASAAPTISEPASKEESPLAASESDPVPKKEECELRTADTLLASSGEEGAPDGVLLGESSWATEYCVFGVLSSKNDQKVMDLYKTDGRLQVLEEVGAPRLSYLGLPSATSGPVDDAIFAGFEAPCKPPSQRVFWLAAFDSKECYNTEHKARPSNKAFVPEFMSCWANWPEEGLKMPEQMKEVFALSATALDGQYMGPYWHLEKAGKSVDSNDIFSIVVYVKAKSPSAAQEIISLNKAHGVQQLNSELGAVRYSIIPPHKTGVEGVGSNDMPPLPSDDEITVTWVESFESQQAYALHRETQHVEAFTAKLKESIEGEIVVLEFSDALHLAKPLH
eukprot:gnl/MRDRNA2_/MRDRNA2_31220_c0_seq1.p1 gnl/MRDRNA2_/MRDRNA2_31220_c0~~gnl/MRDRNA2_/MRDRNA2_31220_c0_seq1.p1  ORF type:complete len:371 (+),score=57.06 gnl/MRDRNA2_/MRDRNA2_31220_c0_seq1:67-1179(+)